MTIQTSEELEYLQEAYGALQLKLQHFRQKVFEQEEAIADLRVEVTQLNQKLEQERASHVVQEPTEAKTKAK